MEKHKKWIEAAKFLGCHTVRVNGYSDIAWSENPADATEASKLVTDGIRQLCEFAAPYGTHIVIENHGGFSSNGKYALSSVNWHHGGNGGGGRSVQECFERLNGRLAERFNRGTMPPKEAFEASSVGAVHVSGYLICKSC